MEKIGNGWDELLENEMQKPYFLRLSAAIAAEYKSACVYPPQSQIFRALSMVKYDDVRVLILGQDPYHGVRQANGIAFAVNESVPLPPSLKNIYREIESDLGVQMPNCGSLLGWEKQGVLLLNTTLTVRESQPQSHAMLGWQTFTDAVISLCARREKPMVFMLWGAGAQQKKALIPDRHLVLCAPHPSPLSAYRGFFGCKHFSRANAFLKNSGQPPVRFECVDDVPLCDRSVLTTKST